MLVKKIFRLLIAAFFFWALASAALVLSGFVKESQILSVYAFMVLEVAVMGLLGLLALIQFNIVEKNYPSAVLWPGRVATILILMGFAIFSSGLSRIDAGFAAKAEFYAGIFWLGFGFLIGLLPLTYKASYANTRA